MDYILADVVRRDRRSGGLPSPSWPLNWACVAVPDWRSPFGMRLPSWLVLVALPLTAATPDEAHFKQVLTLCETVKIVR